MEYSGRSRLYVYLWRIDGGDGMDMARRGQRENAGEERSVGSVCRRTFRPLVEKLIVPGAASLKLDNWRRSAGVVLEDLRERTESIDYRAVKVRRR